MSLDRKKHCSTGISPGDGPPIGISARSKKWIRRHRTGAMMMVLCLGSMGFVAAPAMSAAASSHISALRQGLNFYRGQTITLIYPSSAGSNNDINAREVMGQVANYLHCTINVEDISAGAGFTGSDEIAHSTPNGLTIGLLLTANDVVDVAENVPSLNFNPGREVFLGNWPTTPFMLMDHASDPYTTFQSLQSATPSNPVTVVSESNNGPALQLDTIFKAFGINYRDITGFTTSNQQYNGWVANDGQLLFLGDDGVGPYVKAGVGRALAVAQTEARNFEFAPQMRGIPSFTQLLASWKPKTAVEKKASKLALPLLETPSTAFVAPARTPANRYLALQAAVKYALNTSTVKRFFLGRGSPAGYDSPQNEKIQYLQGLAATVKAVQTIGN